MGLQCSPINAMKVIARLQSNTVQYDSRFVTTTAESDAQFSAVIIGKHDAATANAAIATDADIAGIQCY